MLRTQFHLFRSKRSKNSLVTAKQPAVTETLLKLTTFGMSWLSVALCSRMDHLAPGGNGNDRYAKVAESVLLCGSNSVVECDLAKVEVAGSNPVSRSKLLS